MVPHWFHVAAVISLWAGAVCALIIVADESRRPQKMWIMNLVWPLTALFGSVVLLWFYFERRRDGRRDFPSAVATGTLHCGAGCMLGDIVAETVAYAAPAVAVWFGWQGLFADRTYAVWVLDFLLAFGFGIVFQYFAIAPMRHLKPAEGIVAALKADALSLTAWQVGMYAAMALGRSAVLHAWPGARFDAGTAAFWFVMQAAMIAGFVTSYPANWVLLRTGIKERM
jgi:hypothetical protein